MFEVLFSRHPALFIPVIAIVTTGAVFGTWLVMHYWSAARRHEIDAGLKQDMLSRGLSPADIERVLWASSGGPQAERPAAEEISASPY